MKAAAEKAVALDPKLAEGHAHGSISDERPVVSVAHVNRGDIPVFSHLPME
ncbi:MAG: hypothetical protein ACHQDB_00040 [Steroidobacterales bacterium]